MRILILVTVIAGLAPTAFAAPKLITCEDNVIDDGNAQQYIYQSILDTDDFEKEGPEHEATLISVTGEGLCEDCNLTRGKTFRLPFKVTASTLTLMWKRFDSFAGLGMPAMDYRKLDISRKDLTHETGKCTIEDYGADNAI